MRIEAGVRKFKEVSDAATLEKVPVDGIISEGRSAFEESMIAGALMPVIRVPGGKAK